MTNEEYSLLRSIAAADCTEGPNFDPVLLSHLLDVFDAAQALADHYRKSMNVGPGLHVTTETLLWHNLRQALGESA